MRSRKLPILASMLFSSIVLLGQGPISDVVKVTLPQPTQVGSHLVEAGDYQIRQLSTASSPRLLEFSTSNGTKFEIAVTAIPTLDNNNRKETSVVLEQRGSQQFLKRIWIAGKSYGYEIPVDESKIVRAAPESRRLVAAYQPPAPTQTASVAPPPEPAPAPVPEPVEAAAPEPAQASAPEPALAPAPEPVTEPALAPPAPAPQNTPEMPATADGWTEMLLWSFTLAGAAVFLRKPYQ